MGSHNILKKSALRLAMLVLFTFFSFQSGFAQQEEKAILAVIDQLFEGMKAGDSSKVRAVFHEEARLMTASFIDGKPVLQESDINGFIKKIGSPRDAVWDEQILSSTVQIDGNLASVWTDYSFYVGDKFNHCGVNAFQLFMSEDGWKIIQITDTRRKENCIKK